MQEQESTSVVTLENQLTERFGLLLSQTQLAELLRQTQTPYPAAFILVNPEEAAPVIRVVGELNAQGKGSMPAANLLLRNGSRAALAYLNAATSGSPGDEVLLGLLRGGSAPAIEAATNAAGTVTLELLQKVRAGWYTVKGDEPAWKQPIDSRAASAFIEAVFARSTEPKVKLAAATMLREIGEQPDTGMLLAAAKEPPKEVKAAATGRAARRAQQRRSRSGRLDRGGAFPLRPPLRRRAHRKAHGRDDHRLVRDHPRHGPAGGAA